MRAAALSVLATCCPCEADYVGTGERLEESDRLFHLDPRWLGGDAAYSIDLGDDRSLWLFGDSFIATSPALTRRESTLVRNSVAVMTGRDPTSATMQFAWRDGTPPTSFFPEEGDRWFWPSHGFRVPNGRLVIFLSEVRATPGEGLGFAAAGWRAVQVADPSGPPSEWVVEPLVTPPAPHAPDSTFLTCTAVERVTADDWYLNAFAIDDTTHDARLVRWSGPAIEAGDLSSPEWWDGSAFVAQDRLARPPAVVMRDAPTECSVTPTAYEWFFIASRGFGATTVAFRTSYALAGPWSEPEDMFTPPESSRDNAFVYAAKAHPQLAGTTETDFLVTYADNSFTFADLFDPANEQTLYWPHFARVRADFHCK